MSDDAKKLTPDEIKKRNNMMMIGGAIAAVVVFGIVFMSMSSKGQDMRQRAMAYYSQRRGGYPSQRGYAPSGYQPRGYAAPQGYAPSGYAPSGYPPRPQGYP